MFTVKQQRAIICFLLFSLVFSSFGFVAAPQEARASNLPEIFITELVPNAKNISSPKYDEAYEMIELYNNSSQNVRLGDLKIVNREGLKDSDTEKPPWSYDAVEAEKIIPPKGVMVVWLKQSTNPFTFNDFYNFQLTKNPALKKESVAVATSADTNLHNTLSRTLIVYKGNKKIVTASYIGVGNVDTVDDKGIHYSYPIDGSIEMRKTSYNVASTPGTVTDSQVVIAPFPDITPSVTWGDSQATISWEAPSTENKTDYQYVNIMDSTGQVRLAGPILKGKTSAVVKPLENGRDYSFVVKLVNEVMGLESSGAATEVGRPTGSTVPPLSGVYQDSIDPVGIKEQPVLADFFNSSQKGPVIPGLQQYLVPQGMAYDKTHNWLLISHYREGKSSMLSVTDMATGKLIKAMELYSNASTAYKGHAGGVAVSPNDVWLSSDYQVYRIAMADLVNAQDGGRLIFSSSFNTETKGSFLTYEDGVLWSGEYEDLANYATKTSHHLTNREMLPHHGWVAGYRLDEAGIPSAIPEQILSIPDKIQGMAFVQDRIVLSRSGGRTNMSNLMFYKNPLKQNLPSDGTVSVGGTDVPYKILDGMNALSMLTAPPMSEGIFEHNGKLYVLFESGAADYLYNGVYPVDTVYAVNIQPYLQSAAKIPDLLITEISPAPKGTNEPNEFVEIYNTTDKAIDLSNYKLYYYYSPGSSQPWLEGVTQWDIVAKDNITGDVTNMKIEPKGTKIIWLIKPQYTSSPYTVSLFNSEFGTSLTGDQFVYANLKDGDAMLDTGKRFVAIVAPGGDKGKDRISMVAYNESAKEGSCVTDSKSGTVPVTCDIARPTDKPTGESIDYYYPANGVSPDSKFMERRDPESLHQTPTPGTVKPEQLAALSKAAPSDVQSAKVTWGDMQAQISWTEPAIDNNFDVNIYDMNGNWMASASKGTTSYTVKGLENGTDYQFTLKVTRQGLESSGVTTEIGYPTDGVAPAKPTGLTGNTKDGEIFLNWAANTDADLAGYKVYVNDKPISDKKFDADAAQTSIAFRTDDLEDGKTYQISIAAVDTSRMVSEKSAPVSVKYEGGPGGFKGTAGDKSVTLTWNPMLIDLLGYTVYQDGKPLTVSNSVYTVTYSTYSYTVTGLTNGTKYNFAVTGVKKDNKETPKSNTIELTPFVMTGISLDIPSTIPLGGVFNSVVKAVYDGKPAEEIKLNVTYRSGDASIVSIDASGQGKALKPGKTVIEATYGSYKATQNIEVKEELVSLELNGVPAAPFYVGDKAQLKVTAKYSDQSTKEVTAGVSYTVDPSAVATVSTTGLLEGKAKGEAVIKATFGGKSAEQKITVSEKVSPVTLVSLEIIGIIPNFYPGDKVQLKLVAKYSDNTTKDVTNSAAYTSSKTDIVTINSTGMIEGKKTGDTVITADFGGKSVQASVSVIDRPLYTGGGGGGGVISSTSSGSTSSSTLGAASLKAVKENDDQGRIVTRYEVDSTQLGNAFRLLKANERKVTINIGSSEPVIKVALPASTLQEGSKNTTNAAIVVQNGGLSYEIPVKAFNFDTLAKDLGTTADKMSINVIFTAQSGQAADRINAIAFAQNAKPLTTAYDFAIQATAGGKNVEVKSFNGEYLTRTFELTGTVDSSKSTGVIVDPNRGTMNFIPTTFTQSGGKTQASIMSQSNSIYTVIEMSRTFSDVAGHWSQKDVELLASKLVLNGVDDRNFAPDAQITRAQFATMLVTALGLSGLTENVKVTAKFNDVAPTDWFAAAVTVAADKGLISGYENNEFRPNASVTREEMAVMIARAIQLVDQKNSPPSVSPQFSDGVSISGWAKESVAKAVESGIIQGVTATTFEPKQNATRAQAATMLKRMMQFLKFMN